MARPKNPKAYTSTQPVYVDQRYYKAGEVFVTNAEPGKTWEPVDKTEKAVADAIKPLKDDVPLEGLSKAALEAVAVDKGVNPTGLSKDDLITAIKASDDPTR